MSTGLPSLRCERVIDCKQGAVRAVRYNVDGYYCLSCGSDKKLKLWNYETGLLLKTYGGHADEVTDAAGSCDSSFIVSSSLDKSIIYWDVSTGVPVRRLRGHAGGVKCVCFNEDSSIAISGGRDNAVACWDIRTRSLEPIQKMRDAKDCITSVLTNERYIITSSLDGCVRHYDIRAGELICDEIRLPITYLALSKDDQCVLAACRDGVARLLDCESNGILSEYKGHQVEDYHVECGLLENDTIVVSGSCNGDVFLWDLIKSETMRRIEINKGGGVVHSLDTHPKLESILFARRADIYFYTLQKNLEPVE